IILNACRSDPSQRYASAAAMAADLAAPVKGGPPQPVSPPSRPRRTVKAAIAAAVCLGAFVSWSLLNRASNPVRAPDGLVGWWKGENGGRDSAGTVLIHSLDRLEFSAGKVGRGFYFDGEPHRVE